MKFKHKILTVGVTGGIGSGKTTVCKIFEELGAKVIYADELAKELMDNDERLKKKIVKIFGSRAYVGGKLDRKFIADVIFSDERKKKELEAIVHPVVMRKILSEFRRIAKEKLFNFVIVEAALIFESGFDNELDYVVVVDTSNEETKISRIMQRDNCPREDILKRMKMQMDPAKKRKLADIVIQNDDGIEELREKVKFLYFLFDKLANSSRMK